ncbi:MAG: T9SS type A sorting domain-containing protein, partial [Bacteroidota bacterium]|nr:T9SS type A sorting domain-containing protein [Bacteroidota bacterium]
NNPVIVITDVSGKTLKSERLTGSTGVYAADMSSFAPGIYFYHIEYGSNKTMANKLIIQK